MLVTHTPSRKEEAAAVENDAIIIQISIKGHIETCYANKVICTNVKCHIL